jgi:L-fuconolactonase
MVGTIRIGGLEMADIGDAKGEYRGLSYRNDADLAAWLSKRPAEAALEPELPIIDPHHHFWDTPHRGRYFLPELLADLGGGHNIVATVFVECQAMYRKDGPAEMAPVGEVEFVNGIAAMSASGGYGPCRIAETIIGYADLRLGARVRDVLEAEIAAGNGRFHGIRQGASWDAADSVNKFAARPVPPHMVRDPTFREGFAQLAKLGLSFESWQYHPQLSDAIDLARAFPDTTIILDHVGGVLGVGPYSGRRSEILASWRKDIKDLAGCPNVNVKLGGIGMTSFGFEFHERAVPPSSEELARAWRQYVEPCIEAFGVDRCMFESNFPPDKQSGGYTELWNAFKHITSGASAAEKKALYSGTAARVYHMKVP